MYTRLNRTGTELKKTHVCLYNTSITPFQRLPPHMRNSLGDSSSFFSLRGWGSVHYAATTWLTKRLSWWGEWSSFRHAPTGSVLKGLCGGNPGILEEAVENVPKLFEKSLWKSDKQRENLEWNCQWCIQFFVAYACIAIRYRFFRNQTWWPSKMRIICNCCAGSHCW